MVAAETQRLQSVLSNAGITHHILKGPRLAQKLHADSGMRHSRDIDVIIHPDQLLAALALLRSHGWQWPNSDLWFSSYEVEEERPWWRVLSVMFGLTIVLGVLYPIALVEIVYGDQAGKIVSKYLGAPAHFEFFWRIAQWTIVAILLLCPLTVLYRFGPNLKDRRLQWSVPGAVVAVTLWVASTLVLRVYQQHFSSSRIYGGLNAVATLLMWLYATGAAIFTGGAANSEIEKAATMTGRLDGRRAGAERSGAEHQ